MKVRFVPMLWRYLAEHYTRSLLAVLMGMWGLIYLFDTVELMRRATGKEDVTTSLILEMGLLKLPEAAPVLLPFAVLVAAMFTLWFLARAGELTVMRASGFSPRQMLVPLVVVSLCLGVIQIVILDPLGAALLNKYERLESRYLKHTEAQITMFAKGFWLHQENKKDKNYVILHANRIERGGENMENVTALIFDAKDTPLLRVDAPIGRLEHGRWVLENAYSYDLTQQNTQEDLKKAQWILPTQMTPQDFARSFTNGRSMTLWALPEHIEILESTGFDALPLRVRYHHILAGPLVLIAMVLLAAALFVRPARGRGALIRAILGIVGGFTLFFATRFAEALGETGQIPPLLAAWGPPLAAFFIAVSLVLHLEEG